MLKNLCETCRHAKIITSDRGSIFFMCALSKTDSRFDKYPRLPVFTCSGYHEIQIGASSSNKKKKQ